MGTTLQAHASAPGKVILFGEHAVVYGEPCVSLALDRRIRVTAEVAGSASTVNGERLDEHRHGYLRQALRLLWTGPPIRITTTSEIPSASGIGSSAALSVATAAALLRLARGSPPSAEAVAQAAFETELATQGAASPNDTSVSTAGGAVLVSPGARTDATPLWTIRREARAWHVHRLPLPALPLVIANTGARGRTAEQVAKVRRALDQDRALRDVIHEIGDLTQQATRALAANDLPWVGRLMDRNHECLTLLGVGTPALQRLVEVARSVPGTYGAKLTGAGGGGSIVVLTRAPEQAREALERAGAASFIAQPSPRGVEAGP